MKIKVGILLINMIISIVISFLTVLPWWTFLIGTFGMGFIFSFRNLKINSFMIGFFSGFFNWVVMAIFYHQIYNGNLFAKMAEILFISPLILTISIGVISGILNGLAFFSGYSIFVKDDLLEL